MYYDPRTSLTFDSGCRIAPLVAGSHNITYQLFYTFDDFQGVPIFNLVCLKGLSLHVLRSLVGD